MSKILKRLLITTICLGTLLVAIPTNDTNIVKNKAEIVSIEKTTFSNIDPLFDGIVASKPGFSVTGAKEQENIILQLKHPFYLRQIKIFVDKEKGLKNLSVRYSKSTDFWIALDDISKEETESSIVYTVSGEYVLATYLSFIFEADPKNNKEMLLQEIEIYPEMDLRLRSRHIRDNWLTTDRECFDDIDTVIDAVKHLRFSETGAPEANKFKRMPAPTLESELISVGGLEPGTSYEYKMSVTDFNGNILDLESRRFNTRPLSYAYNKKAEGTFNKHYNGSPFKTTENVLTNGSTDINEGLAMSGSVKKEEQYVIIDLGAQKNISEVVLLWRNLGYSKDYAIQISNDKVAWQTVAEHQNAANVQVARSVEGHPLKPVFTRFAKTPARYVKILIKKDSDHYTKHGTSELELFEVKVF